MIETLKRIFIHSLASEKVSFVQRKNWMKTVRLIIIFVANFLVLFYFIYCWDKNMCIDQRWFWINDSMCGRKMVQLIEVRNWRDASNSMHNCVPIHRVRCVWSVYLGSEKHWKCCHQLESHECSKCGDLENDLASNCGRNGTLLRCVCVAHDGPKPILAFHCGKNGMSPSKRCENHQNATALPCWTLLL